MSAGFRLGSLVLAVSLLLQGCSFATRFAYNHLDWLANRELAKYIDLNDAQEQWLEPRFNQFWDWHRDSQLPLYADDLRQLMGAVERGLTRDDLLVANARIEQHWISATEALRGDAIGLLRQLDDAQVAQLLERVDERNQEFMEERLAVTEQERREQDRERARKWFDKRLGSVSLAQRESIEQWLNKRLDLSDQWQARRQWWRAAFADALARRDQAGASDELATLLFDSRSSWSDVLRDQVEVNQELWLELTLAVERQASDKQRQHLREYLGELAEDFEALASQSR